MLSKHKRLHVRKVNDRVDHGELLVGEFGGHFSDGVSLEETNPYDEVNFLLSKEAMEFFHLRHFSWLLVGVDDAKLGLGSL